MDQDGPVVTLPLAGRDQGWGGVWPEYSGSRPPLPASPVKGEVPSGGWGILVPYMQ